MIVVQFLTTDKDSPGNDVGRCIRAFEVPIPPVMPDAVDYPSGKEWYPKHLHSKDHNSYGSKQSDVDDQNSDNTRE